MSQAAGKGILADAVGVLHHAWHRCHSAWNDSTATKFEQEFVSPVESAARQAGDAMDRLQSVCDEAKRACE